MAIRQHVEYDGKKYYRYVNFGASISNELMNVAKDALVFMVVGINGT